MKHPKHQRLSSRRGFALSCFCLASVLLAGCVSGPPLAPVNLSAAGWTARRGQAVWKPGTNKPELTGDLLLASDQRGNHYLEFSKTIPLLTFRTSDDRWELNIPPENKHHSGRGNGPNRLAWAQLIRFMDGGEPAKGWDFAKISERQYVLVNDYRGERLEVHLEE